MSEETIVEHCSPTLAGLKTGNLFSCSFPCRRALTEDLRRFNRIFVPRGVRIIPLRYSSGRALLYLYRPDRLSRDLSREGAVSILRGIGYGGSDAQQLRFLIRRLESSAEFPHEIGLFLSYPAEDVRGFMVQGPEKYKCIGFWKVYGDEQSAKKTFCKYRRCHKIYVRQLRSGVPLSKLTVVCREK